MSKDHSTTPDGFKRCSSGDACIHLLGCFQPATLEYFGSNGKYFASKCRKCTNALERQQRKESDQTLEQERRRQHPDDYDEWIVEHLERLDYQARGLKCCSSGDNCKNSEGCLLPATTDYFHKKPRGLHPLCKACEAHIQRVKRFGDNLDDYLAKIAERQRLKSLGLKRCSAGDTCIHPEGADLPATIEYFRQRSGRDNQLMPRCIPCEKARANESARKNGHARANRWRAKHPDIMAAQQSVRRARVKNLPNTLTPEEWQRCLIYWGNRCAYCSQKPFNIHIEHYVAIANKNCPGTVALNIIPACEQCNTSKRDALPIAWLSANFPPIEVTAIMERIETYFEWVKSQHED